MIPMKLAVRNFMCYCDNVPPLNFSGIHTASISGDNGNGKSALIDAMTWALWGEARAKSDDELIHLGQPEMEVEFDFAVGEQGYRIIRKHARPKRRRASGQTLLEFQIATDNGFRPITGNSIRETQQQINQVLHLDYDTFVNSALLLQGHADRFTRASPAQRKQVLANILGLSLYDELEEQAKELAKSREGERALAESAIGDIDGELAQKPTYEAELKKARDELSRIEEMVGRQESRLNELRQKMEVLKSKQEQLTQLEQHSLETAKTLDQWNEQIGQHNSRIKEYQEVIARRSTIEAGYTQLTETRKLNEELNQKLRMATTLNERKHKLEMTIVQSSQALLNEHALLENKISELEARSKELPELQAEAQQTQAELKRLAEEAEALSAKKQAAQELVTRVHDLESSRVRLEQEIAEIEEKLGLLHSESGAKCPLCETLLGAEGLKLIEIKFSTDKQLKFDSLGSKEGELAQKKTELNTAETETSRLETRLSQERTAIQGRASLIGQRINEIENAEKELDQQRKRLDEIEGRLARKDFATGEQQALKQIEDEIAGLDYDPSQHEAVRHRSNELEQHEAPKRKLEEADRLIGQEKEALAGAEKAARELSSALESDEQKRGGLSAELSALSRLSGELNQAETEQEELRPQQKQAQELVGGTKGKLERLTELETKRKEREETFSQAVKEEKIYRDLAQAFGKKGIQALLIEIALPEIETGANALLGRMTDNRMHVKIETQRETKKGDLLETLDITISDELGTRSYELFSGGEAFRINFAIRIALSKLLARRAGAPLPTLIVDEGFGTQDGTGLEKLKEAIISIQDDFERIFIITHIEELRDAFPTRIDVTKTAQGSSIEVN